MLTTVWDQDQGRSSDGPGGALGLPLTARERALLAGLLEEVRLAKDAPVFLQGDRATHLYWLSRGLVRTSKTQADGRRQVTGFLYPGEVLGLSYRGTYNHSAEALNEAVLHRLPLADLDALLEAAPNLTRRLLEITSNELAAAQDQMVLLGCRTARERVASFLLGLSRRAGRQSGAAAAVDLPMSRADIADYLGLSTESVSRALTELKREGLIEMAKAHRVVIRDRAALEAGIGAG